MVLGWESGVLALAETTWGWGGGKGWREWGGFIGLGSTSPSGFIGIVRTMIQGLGRQG